MQKRVRLRSEQELADERERMELWYWRGDTEIPDEDLAEVVAQVAAAGLIPIVDGDFALSDGTSYVTLSEEDQDELNWVAEQRLRALNWVCGFGDSWETAPLDID